MTRLAKALLLLLALLVCGVGAIITHLLRARVVTPLPCELFAVVNAQLASFRNADFPSAYRYAATGVQQKFTLPQFEKMVRQNYGEMTGAHRVEFGFVKMEGSGAVVQVFFFAENGSARSFIYTLVHESDRWKISGVQEVQRFLPHERLSGLHI